MTLGPPPSRARLTASEVALINGKEIGAIDGHCRQAEASGAPGDITPTHCVVMAGPFAVTVILENKDGWKLEHDGHIDGFKDQALIRTTIARKRDTDVAGF